MLRSILVPALLAAAAGLLTASHAHAYGACHTGYTHVGPGGVQHVGQTTAVGPGGQAYHHSSAGAAGPAGGAYSSSTTRAYSPSAYGGYSAGGSVGYGASVSHSTAYYR
jgi:hypothetical protein